MRKRISEDENRFDHAYRTRFCVKLSCALIYMYKYISDLAHHNAHRLDNVIRTLKFIYCVVLRCVVVRNTRFKVVVSTIKINSKY